MSARATDLGARVAASATMVWRPSQRGQAWFQFTGVAPLGPEETLKGATEGGQPGSGFLFIRLMRQTFQELLILR